MLTRTLSPLQVEEVSDPNALEALRPEWSELWQRCSRATPFQSPEWLLPWWRHIGQGKLWVLVFRNGERLAGLIPCSVYTMPGSGLRQLMLLGSGNTDYLDPPLEEETAGQAVRLFFERIGQRRDRWDLCDLQQLSCASPFLKAELPGWEEDVGIQDVCPVLKLPPAGGPLASCVPPRMLWNFRYGWRRAQRNGDFQAERADWDTFDEAFEALLRLHGARWQTRGEDGVLAPTPLQRFHLEVAAGFLRTGLLRLYSLRLGGQIIASYYGFLHGGRAYYYLSGFDPACESLSPGTLVVGHALSEAIREGATEFDFLRGREEYKYRWGARERPNYCRKLRLPAGSEGGRS